MPDKPNLLFIFTDQQRADTMACYGNDVIRTPNLDALARESFVFENAYVSQPVCTPSRGTIMTGLYPHTHGAISNNVALGVETRTIAEMVSGDYVRAYYGKWHLGDELFPQHGFERRVSIEDTYRRYYSRRGYRSRVSDYHHFLVAEGLSPDTGSKGSRVFSRQMAAELPEELTKAAFLGREAARFIREARDRPFALYVNFLEPHNPYAGPLNEMYSRDELNTGPQFLHKPPRNASVLHRMMADYYGQQVVEGHDLRTEVGWREIRARYWGNVTLVDRAVGKVLGALDETGQAGNTIVVFTSEHGDMLGDHTILAKSVMYEEAVRVPLIVRAPWLGKPGKLIRGRASHIDLAPTLLDLLGAPIPGELEGVSLTPVLQGETNLEKNDVFVEWNGSDSRDDKVGFETDIPHREIRRVADLPWRTIISAEGWKLNLSPGDQCELYDLNTDPHEMVNLFDESGHGDRVRDLTERIARWQERYGDSAPLPGG